jgi:hypothetical protein
MNSEALRMYIKEIKENAKEARAESVGDIYEAGRNMAFLEVLGILKRYFITYEPDTNLADFGLGMELENELL